MYSPLPTRPDIDQLRLRARELRDAVVAGSAQANLRVHRQRGQVPQDPAGFPLRNAQSVIAREHGFTSWAGLKQYIDSLANTTADDGERVPGQPHSRERLRRLSREKYQVAGSQVQDMLDKYRLGVLATFRTVGGTNFPNTVIDVCTASGESFIIKIQTRSLPGWSLSQEHRAIRALQRADEVPVSEKCELDESGDLLPHPYLISNRLEGRQGEIFFEQTSHELRLSLAEQLGVMLGRIHEPTPPAGLPAFPEGLQTVEEALLGNATLRRELNAQVSGFERRLRRRLNAAEFRGVKGDDVLLKVEAGLHNLLVEENGRRVRISGLFDFQAARLGPAITDLTNAEGSIATHTARGSSCPPGKLESHYVEGLRKAYGALRGVDTEFDFEQRLMFDTVQHARQVRYWWDLCEYLHPKNPLWVERVLLGLTRLGSGTELPPP